MNRIDQIRPDAPVLARPGPHPVGIETVIFTRPDQPDLSDPKITTHHKDRHLTVTLWYPAAKGSPQGGTYETLIRDGITRATLRGPARDGLTPADGPFPLVILSHGWPGNRWLMSPHALTLASHGYVVAAIDHEGSTYDNQEPVGATFYHRPRDQRFVLDCLAAPDAPLKGVIDTDCASVIGYSMGGYGALVFGGAGLSETAMSHDLSPAEDLLRPLRAGTADHEALTDPRVKAIVAFGPWGGKAGLWDAAGLAGLRAPLLLIAGTADDTSGYDAMRGIWEGATGVARHLLTFEMAGHNAGAPMPAPAESYGHSEQLGWPPFLHYADDVWDSVRMNNVAAHFCVAFLDRHLKGSAQAAHFLEAGGEHWPGFFENTATGLKFETVLPAP